MFFLSVGSPNIFFICCCLIQSVTPAPTSQNFHSKPVARHLAEFFQNGAAARRDFGFQIPAFSMNAKDADESAGQRRKRSANSDEMKSVTADEDAVGGAGPKTSLKKLLRNMNAPCYAGGMGGNGGTGGGGNVPDDGGGIIEEARRRMARIRAKAAKAKKAKKSKKGQTSKGRRRRQTEIDDLATGAGDRGTEWREKLQAHMQDFTEKMSRVYENISAGMMDMMKRMGQRFGGGGEN